MAKKNLTYHTRMQKAAYHFGEFIAYAFVVGVLVIIGLLIIHGRF